MSHLSTETDLAEAARAMAILALQGNDYHRGSVEFRDAVDKVLVLTRPVGERACDALLAELERL